mgnify:CR=1 FL=1
MRNNKARRGRHFSSSKLPTVLILLLLDLTFSLPVLAAFQPFVIQDIRVEGLQRISEGTVYNYLPLDRGDTLNGSSARAAIRELNPEAVVVDAASPISVLP